MAEAETAARGDSVLRGLVKIACSVALAEWRIRPIVAKFLAEYPEVEVEMNVSDQPIDLLGEGIDIAIRGGALKSSELLARKIGTSERVCLATPAYLAKHGEPKSPHELANHNCIQYTLLTSGNVWSFGDQQVAVKGRYRTNSLDGVRAALLSGMGIGLGPVWMFEREILDGSIKAVLTDSPPPIGDIHLLYPAKRLIPRRVTLLMDAIAASFKDEPTLNSGSLGRLLRAREERLGGSCRSIGPCA